MDVEERLILVEGEVSGQRQDLQLLLLVEPQVGLLLRFEVADDGAAHRSDTGEVAGRELVLAGEGHKTLHHLLARVEHEEVRFHLPVGEKLRLRQVRVLRRGFARAGGARRGQPGCGDEAPPGHRRRFWNVHRFVSALCC